MPDYIKQLKENGINQSSDGLLCDFIARELYSAAIDQIAASIAKREAETQYLKKLAWELCHRETSTMETNT